MERELHCSEKTAGKRLEDRARVLLLGFICLVELCQIAVEVDAESRSRRRTARSGRDDWRPREHRDVDSVGLHTPRPPWRRRDFPDCEALPVAVIRRPARPSIHWRGLCGATMEGQDGKAKGASALNAHRTDGAAPFSSGTNLPAKRRCRGVLTAATAAIGTP